MQIYAKKIKENMSLKKLKKVAGDEAFLAQLNCGLSQCTFISCTIGPLAKKQFTLFKVNIVIISMAMVRIANIH